MSDDSPTEGVRPSEGDPELLLYDFLKYLATLALLILGAVLSLSGSDSSFSKRNLAIVIFIVIHVGLVVWTGLFNNMRAMITGWFVLEPPAGEDGDRP